MVQIAFQTELSDFVHFILIWLTCDAPQCEQISSMWIPNTLRKRSWPAGGPNKTDRQIWKPTLPYLRRTLLKKELYAIL